MNKFLTSSYAKMSVMALAVGGFLTAQATHAAADADLVSALASTSGMLSDNKGSIMTFFVAVGLVVLVLAIAKGGLNWAIAKIAGVFGRKKRR